MPNFGKIWFFILFLFVVIAVNYRLSGLVYHKKLQIGIYYKIDGSTNTKLFYKTNWNQKFSGKRALEYIKSTKTDPIKGDIYELEHNLNPRSVRVDFENNINIISIKKIEIKGYFNKYIWNPEDIVIDFRPINAKQYLIKEYLELHPLNHDPYLVYKKDFLDRLKLVYEKSVLLSNYRYIIVNVLLLICSSLIYILFSTRFWISLLAEIKKFFLIECIEQNKQD